MATLKSYSIVSDVACGAINIERLTTEVDTSGNVEGFAGLLEENGSVKILGESILDETALDELIFNHQAVLLSEAQAAKCLEIDMRTGALFANGFTYDSTQFSLSTNAQINWMSLRVLKDLFTWPLEISTLNNETYRLAFENIDDFCNIARDTIYNNLTSGRLLKKAVTEATSIEEVNAVIDHR